jgi:universal stress protein E
MLVKPGSGALPQHVLAAVDPLDEYGCGNELNEDILKAAEKYGMQTDATVEVAHAFQFIPVAVDPGFMSGWVPDLTLQQELRDLHAKALRDLGVRFGVEERHLHMLDGDPAKQIAGFAETYHTGLVIMGTVNRNDLQRLFIGSVAEDLLDRLHCDILALKPAGFAAELAERLDDHTSKAA